MRVSTTFVDGRGYVNLTPENEWEQRLLGGVANGGSELDCSVRYDYEGHYGYGKCKLVSIELKAKEPHAEQTDAA